MASTALICMAMEGEAAPVIAALGLRPDGSAFDPRLPFRAWSGRRDGLGVHLTVSGKDPRHGVDNIGTQPAALQAWLSIEAFKPDAVISAGTCGGFEAGGFQIGEVIAGGREYLYHDRIVPLPGFDAYARGHYPAPDAGDLARALGIRTGKVASGNALETSERDLEFFHRHEVVAKEMEAASVAWACWMAGVPFYSLKAVTDFIDHPAATADQFSRNFSSATARLCEKLPPALDWLAAFG